jgi:DNA invertase Pin-like site-specific DNA recombinase
MLIGYARVSTQDQDTAAQVAALKAAGCEEIYREKASGGRWNRPKLQETWWWSGSSIGCPGRCATC